MQKNKSGITMIEVLIAMGIISLVLLSLLIAELSMMQSINQSRLKTIATIQLMNFSEILLLHATSDVRRHAFHTWNKDNARLLPRGAGHYRELGNHQCEIQLDWFLKKRETASIVVFCG